MKTPKALLAIVTLSVVALATPSFAANIGNGHQKTTNDHQITVWNGGGSNAMSMGIDTLAKYVAQQKSETSANFKVWNGGGSNAMSMDIDTLAKYVAQQTPETSAHFIVWNGGGSNAMGVDIDTLARITSGHDTVQETASCQVNGSDVEMN